MDPRDVAIARSARRAYELGRARAAAKLVPIVVAMAAFGASATESVPRTVAIASALAVLVLVLAWRGRDGGHGVLPGLVAGAFPLALPLLIRAVGPCCIGGGCWNACLPMCIGAGVAAGLLVGVWTARETRAGARVATSALAVAGLAGAMGCFVAGTSGLAGMAVGLLAGSAPVVLLARIRRPSAP